LRTGAEMGKGALGISSETSVVSRKAPCMATRAPPAETLSALANSSRSFPLESRLRTNRGMGSGSRDHARRSDFIRGRSKGLAPFLTEPLGLSHLRCQTQESSVFGLASLSRYVEDSQQIHRVFTDVSRRLLILSGNWRFFWRRFWKEFTDSGKCFAFFVDTSRRLS
jgi:hypothetical protein